MKDATELLKELLRLFTFIYAQGTVPFFCVEFARRLRVEKKACRDK
jgi:hypothetical protein